MKPKGESIFDRRERQLSLEYLVFLLVVGTMMAASLILLGFQDQKLAPGGGILLGVLVLLELYAFDWFRKAHITYEWTPAAVYLHGKWLEREIVFREGVCASGMKLRLPSRFHYWRRESFLVLWKPGERNVDPETLPIFLLARKEVVLLPDTAELRAKFRETLGQDVPEFPQVCTVPAKE